MVLGLVNGLFCGPTDTLAQAITQPDIKGFFRFERYGEVVALGTNVVKQLDDALLLASNRVFVRSLDSGRTWNPVLSPLKPKNIATILAHGSTIVVGATMGGVHRTSDHGLHWERYGNEPRLRKVQSLLRTTNGYMALNDSGVCFKRSDTDTAWQVLALPAPCRDFVMFNKKPWFVCEDGSVLHEDAPASKPNRHVGIVDRVELVVVGDNLAVVLDTSVLVLNADADSIAAYRLPVPNWTACVTYDNQLLLGGRSTGLRKLNLETGESTFVFAGPSEAENISALAVSGASIVIGTSRGSGRCYVVREQSQDWHALNAGRVEGTFDVTDIACANGFAYVATREEGVHAGMASGTALFPIHNGYERTIFAQLIPWRRGMIVVARRGGIFYMQSGAGPLEWLTRTLPQSYDYFAATIGSRIVVGLDSGRTMWTDDGGTTWTQAATTLPSINDLNCVGEVVYASTLKGLYRSDDQGENWRAEEGPWGQGNVLWVAGSSDTIFVATPLDTYRRLKNGAAHTKLIAESAPDMPTIFTTITLRDGLLFAAGVPSLKISSDVGDTWHSKTIEGASAIVSQFFYKDYYYIVTDRGALWRSPTP